MFMIWNNGQRAFLWYITWGLYAKFWKLPSRHPTMATHAGIELTHLFEIFIIIHNIYQKAPKKIPIWNVIMLWFKRKFGNLLPGKVKRIERTARRKVHRIKKVSECLQMICHMTVRKNDWSVLTPWGW